MISSTALLFAAVLATVPDSLSHGPTPDWVQDVRVPTQVETIRGESGMRYLLVANQTLYEQDGSVSYHRRFAVQPRSQRSVGDAALIQFDFDPSYQKVIIHGISVLRDGERSNRLVMDDFELLHRELTLEADIYDGRRTANAVLADIRVGDIVEWDFTIVGRNPILGPDVFGEVSLGWSVPIHRAFNRVVYPKNVDLNIRTVADAPQPRKRKRRDMRELIWDQEQVPRFVWSELTPTWHATLPAASFSAWHSWQEVVDWAQPIYQKSSTTGDWLQTVIKRIQAKASSPVEQALAALEIVQDEVRYFGVELGENSHRPSPPAETWQRRFGDCKDKVVLLRTMLDALGIESAPALVSVDRERGIAQLVPSPYAFDHVILRVLVDGQTLWVDPTRMAQRGQLDSRSFPDYGLALPIADGVIALAEMARPAEWQFKLSTSERFNSIDEFAAQLSVDMRYGVDLADMIRGSISEDGLAHIEDYLYEHYNTQFGEALSSTDLLLEDRATINQVALHTSYELPTFWETVDEFRRVETYAASVADYLPLPNRSDTNGPIAIPFPLKLSHTIEVADLHGLIEEQTPEPVIIEDSWMRYQRTVHYDAGRAIIDHKLETFADHAPAENVRSHIGNRRQIRDALSHVVVAISENRNQLRSQNKRLKSSLRRLIGEDGQ